MNTLKLTTIKKFLQKPNYSYIFNLAPSSVVPGINSSHSGWMTKHKGNLVRDNIVHSYPRSQPHLRSK